MGSEQPMFEREKCLMMRILSLILHAGRVSSVARVGREHEQTTKGRQECLPSVSASSR